MFIDLSRSELLAGYRQVKHARRYLLGKWRFKLLRAYTKRWERYAKNLARQQVAQKKMKRSLPWLAIGLPFLLVSGCGLTLANYQFGFLLVAWALSGSLVAGALWFSFSIKPRLPEHPLAQNSRQHTFSPLKQKLFPKLIPAWWQGLEQKIPQEYYVEQLATSTKQWGLIGEYRLIRELSRVAPPNTLILHSVMPKPKDDLDVVLIGPKGLWYFEVKYINAHFDWHDGVWSVGKIDRKTNQLVLEHMNETPDKQWRRMRAEVFRNLEINGRELLAQHPGLGKIKGGIVLAHRKATFDIQKSPPFRWGTVDGWVREFAQAPILPEITFETILCVADILLKKHQGLNSSQAVYSMKTHTARVLQQTEREIQAWIDAS